MKKPLSILCIIFAFSGAGNTSLCFSSSAKFFGTDALSPKLAQVSRIPDKIPPDPSRSPEIILHINNKLALLPPSSTSDFITEIWQAAITNKETSTIALLSRLSDEGPPWST